MRRRDQACGGCHERVAKHGRRHLCLRVLLRPRALESEADTEEYRKGDIHIP
jgi:hypothetical protein